MPAPLANKSAEKWTLDRTLENLDFIDAYSFNNDCLYLGQALAAAGLYDDVWRYWRRKWKRQSDVICLMKTILQRFEARIFEKMTKREMPVHVGMFVLRHHYGWNRPEDKIKSEKDPLEAEVYEDQNYVEKPKPQKPEPQLEVKEEQPQQPKAKTTSPANPKSYDYMQLKRNQYNALHINEQILGHTVYFDGQPPSGMNAILFDGGYFLKC